MTVGSDEDLVLPVVRLRVEVEAARDLELVVRAGRDEGCGEMADEAGDGRVAVDIVGVVLRESGSEI